MATKAELQTLQNLVQSVLQDGVTDAEAQSVLSMANQIGATPQRLALMAGLPESEVRAAINRFSPGNALLDYEVGFTNPYTTNNAATVNNAAANNAAVNNAATVNNAAASNTRTFTDPITGRTMDVVANDPRLAGKTDSEIISMLFGSATNGTSNAATNNTATNNAANNTVNNNAGDISFTGDNVLTAAAKGINNFNNNPGALGFSDLNPIVTGAEGTTQTAIPEFLKPILADAANAQQGALRSYVDLLTQDNALLSPFNQNQNMSLAMAADLARNDPNNFLGTTQNVLQAAAQGSEVVPLFNRGREFLESGDIIDNLRTMGTTNPLEIIRGEMDSLAGIARGANDISGVGRSTLENIAMGNTPIGGQGRSTLESTARGDFLYGGEGFNAAVDAASRAAMPGINTTFAMGGSGAVDGGLAQAARTQAVADAFARQYGQERANQIAAGNRLLDNQTQRAQQQLTAGNQLLSDQARRLSSQIGAGSQLGSLALGNTAQMQSALTNALRGRQAAGSAMTNIANQERARQLNAALQLPQVGLLNSQILGAVGDRQQAQETARRQANAQAMSSLLNNSFGAINPNALFGNITSVNQSGNSALAGLGGAFTGARIGEMAGFSPGLGALAGGLLGAFG